MEELTKYIILGIGLVMIGIMLEDGVSIGWIMLIVGILTITYGVMESEI